VGLLEGSFAVGNALGVGIITRCSRRNRICRDLVDSLGHGVRGVDGATAQRGLTHELVVVYNRTIGARLRWHWQRRVLIGAFD